jgi:hypothetical protein
MNRLGRPMHIVRVSRQSSKWLSYSIPKSGRSFSMAWHPHRHDRRGVHEAKERENHALSRAVATTALRMAADLELAQAIASLVDGSDDNGIDAIHYDSQERTLFLVQSKWNTSHSGSVDSAAVLKFLQGVQDLVSLKRIGSTRKCEDVGLRSRMP